MSFRSTLQALGIVTAMLGATSASPLLAQERKQRGQLITEGVPDTPQAVLDRVEQYTAVRSASLEGFLENGGVLIKTKFGETEQLHEVATPLGARSQLTFFSEPIADGSAGVRPDGSDTVYFLKDRGGDELFQGFLMDRGTGRFTSFTEPGTRTERVIFDKRGKRAAWSVARSGKAERQIVVGNPSDPNDRKVVFTGTSGGVYDPLAFSPDGRRLLLQQYDSQSDSKRLVIDLATGVATQVNPTAAGKINYGWGEGDFSADGRSVYVVSDEESEFARLTRIDLATNQKTVLTPDINWDIAEFDLSSDGRTLAFVVNEGGSSKLYITDARTGRRLPTPDLPPGVISGLQFDKSGGRLGFAISSGTIPGDVWTWDVRPRKLTRWTKSETGGLSDKSFVTPTLVEVTSFDGLKVPAFLYTPRTPGPHPVVIQIHGGPEAQFKNEFVDPRLQYWVNELGIAVLAPNIRGSGGYGKTYWSLDNGFKREDAIKDIGAILDWISRQPRLDDKRVAVHGGSWGGYAVLSSLANYPDKLVGGIDVVGSSNLVTFLERTDGYRRDLRRVEYGDERDPAMRAYLNKIAPLTNAHNIKDPVFVVHGANDPRVAQAEAEQIVKAVRANGREAWYMLALDEGHGFFKESNVKAWIGAEIMFLRRILNLP